MNISLLNSLFRVCALLFVWARCSVATLWSYIDFSVLGSPDGSRCCLFFAFSASGPIFRIENSSFILCLLESMFFSDIWSDSGHQGPNRLLVPLLFRVHQRLRALPNFSPTLRDFIFCSVPAAVFQKSLSKQCLLSSFRNAVNAQVSIPICSFRMRRQHDFKIEKVRSSRHRWFFTNLGYIS